MFGIASHVQAEIWLLDIVILAVGLYLVMPLVLLALTENCFYSICGYLLVSAYPHYLIFAFAGQDPHLGA